MLILVLLISFSDGLGRRLDINPADVVKLVPNTENGHYHSSIHCVIHTVDGHWTAVSESCDVVRQRLEANPK
jgi:hypothetical protein